MEIHPILYREALDIVKINKAKKERMSEIEEQLEIEANFISTFVEDHLRFHARNLRSGT